MSMLSGPNRWSMRQSGDHKSAMAERTCGEGTYSDWSDRVGQ